MAAFGWWFSSGKFDESWSIERFMKSMHIGTKSKIDYFIIDYLTEVSKRFPKESVDILSSLILKEEPSWVIIGEKDKIETIIQKALISTDPPTQQVAKDLVNRLVARGHTDYADLL
jgi:hypothetical protein